MPRLPPVTSTVRGTVIEYLPFAEPRLECRQPRQTHTILDVELRLLMAKQQSITSLPRSPHDDRRSRMIQYSVTQSIRVVCIFVCFFTPGWWLLIPAIGAVVLPYVAVVLANAGSAEASEVRRPGSIVRRNDETR